MAKRSQNWLPSYSVITMDADSFTIDTYQITETGKTEKIDDTFTIIKDGTSSNDVVTRADAAALLYQLAGSPTVSSAVSFADVDADASYAKAVAWAKSKGIVNGTSADAFAPDDALSREQLFAMAYRYAKAMDKRTPSADLSAYNNASSVSGWAKDGVQFAAAAKLFTGASIAPQTLATSDDVDTALTQLGRL